MVVGGRGVPHLGRPLVQEGPSVAAGAAGAAVAPSLAVAARVRRKSPLS